MKYQNWKVLKNDIVKNLPLTFIEITKYILFEKKHRILTFFVCGNQEIIKKCHLNKICGFSVYIEKDLKARSYGYVYFISICMLDHKQNAEILKSTRGRNVKVYEEVFSVISNHLNKLNMNK